MRKVHAVTLARISEATNIPYPLLEWRINNGFPVRKFRATELVDGELVNGEFDMPLGDPEKPDKNPVTHSYPPRSSPATVKSSNGVKITIKKSKLKK